MKHEHLLTAFVAACLLLCACRTSRTASSKESRQEYRVETNTARQDSAANNRVLRYTGGSSTLVHRRDTCRITIERDSGGQVVSATIEKNYEYSAENAAQGNAAEALSVFASSESNSLTAETSAVGEAEKETEAEVDASLHVNRMVAAVVLIIAILYFILPWIRSKLR